MPLQPPSSMPTQPPQPAAGLSRTRSLRRPQAGPSVSASASTKEAGPGAEPSTAAGNVTSSVLIPRGSSPSRLPVKPPLNLAAAKTVGTAATTAATTGTKARVPSTSSGIATRLRRPEAGTAAGSAPKKAESASTAVPPSASRTYLLSSGATGMTRRPTTAGGLPSSSSSTTTSMTSVSRTRPAGTSGPLRGHTRTKSTSIVPTSSAVTTASATALSAATVLRPPSAQSSSAGSSSTANSRPPTRGATASSTATATTGSHVVTGPVTGHRRHLSATTAPRLEDRKAVTSTAPASAGANRPAFSTLQQHFSPAKNFAPKPRIATILAPPASPSKKPANVALSAETSRLQTTLLHLYLLHRDAADVTTAWHTSARQALAGERFSALSADHAELMQMAGHRAEAANAAALQAWGQASSSDGSFDLTLDEKIQTLDTVLSGVWSLAGQDASSTSRYVHLVRRFERWAQQTAALVAARQRVDTLEELMDDGDSDDGNDRGGSNAARGFLPSDQEPLLDAAWHEECDHLVRKLEGCQRQLGRLGRLSDIPHEGSRVSISSLDRMLAGCHNLVDGMLAELCVMQRLERDAAEQELVWIRQINASTGVSSENGGDNGHDLRSNAQQPARSGAIWRVM